jgi:hypothetical protein
MRYGEVDHGENCFHYYKNGFCIHCDEQDPSSEI